MNFRAKNQTFHTSAKIPKILSTKFKFSRQKLKVFIFQQKSYLKKVNCRAKNISFHISWKKVKKKSLNFRAQIFSIFYLDWCTAYVTEIYYKVRDKISWDFVCSLKQKRGEDGFRQMDFVWMIVLKIILDWAIIWVGP